MATLALANEAEAIAILSMLEGMLEVLEDDGLTGTPDHEDMESAFQWLGNLINENDTGERPLAFPTRVPVELSSSQETFLRNAIENVRDQGDEWNPDDEESDTEPFTAAIED